MQKHKTLLNTSISKSSQNKFEILFFWIDIEPIWVSVVAIEYVTFVTATLSQIDQDRQKEESITNNSVSSRQKRRS